ncbi:MAG: hypothetical protein HOM21_00470, partial [Halobacteriovoraceae bacterium]|nr:hypothetical protein [Halobacteriovoraceae bacterium]
NRRFYSIYKKGLDIIKKHGELRGLTVQGHERMWRIEKSLDDETRENWIFANSTHTIDLLNLFGGKTKTVNSLSKSVSPKFSSADQIAGLVEFESGAIGQYSAFWYSPGGWSATLYGDGVTVEFKPLEKGFVIDQNFETTEIVADPIDTQFKAGFYRQLEAFGNLIKSGESQWPAADIHEALRTMKLADQLR